MVSSTSLKTPSSGKRSAFRWIEENAHTSLILLVIFIGFILRLIAALDSTGMIHPDEIYQSLEISHLLVFGTGRKAAEFQTTNPDIASYAESRSYTFPWIFAFIMEIGKFLGWNYQTQTLLVIRIFLAINATLLIPIIAKLMYQLTKNQNVALYSAIFIAFWFRIIEFTVRSFNNTFFLPILFYGIYRVLLAMERKKTTLWDHLIWAIGLGLSSYNRLDLLAIVFAFFILTFRKDSLQIYAYVALDSLYGMLFCFLVDFHYYKNWSPVPWNWFQFNFTDNGSKIFGVSPWNYYSNELIINDGLGIFVALTGITLLVTLILRYRGINIVQSKTENELILFFHKFSGLTIFVWAVYSSFWDGITIKKFISWVTFNGGWNPESHKEMRFMIGGLIVLLCLLATAIEVTISIVSEIIVQNSTNRSGKPTKSVNLMEYKYWIKVILGCLLIAILLIQSFQYANFRYHREAFSDTNEAMAWVGQQKDLQAVMIALVWFLSGGYTYLNPSHPVNITYADFSASDALARSYYLYTFRNFVANAEPGYYFILPKFQISYYPNVIQDLVINNWIPVKVVQGTAEIWKFAQLSTSV